MSTNNLAAVPTDEGPPDIEKIVGEVAGLVSPPDVCVRVFDLVESQSSSAKDFADVVATDPNLTARLLRIVNSPYFGFARKIDTVSRAIAVVGTRELHSLVISVSAVQSFSNVSPGLINMDTFWRHSIFCGLLAKDLAARCGVLHPERLFVAGLLHDIGCLVLLDRLPGVMEDCLERAQGNEAELHRIEKEILGFDHSDVTGQLLGTWNLPAAIVEAARNHHQFDPDREHGLECAILHVADILANATDIGALLECPVAHEEIEDDIWHLLGLDPEKLDTEELMAESLLKFTETVGLLTGSS